MRTGRKNSMKKRERNNCGYSLSELIIVIAIIAILSSFATMAISVLIGMDAKECAEDISSHLKNVKTNALSKVGAEMRITRDSLTDEYMLEYVEYNYQEDASGNLVEVDTVTKTYVLGKEKCTINCIFSDGRKEKISSTNEVTIGFDRSSGVFSEVKLNNLAQTDVYCTSIEITRNSIIYGIDMIPQTGKISMEKR